MFNYLGKKVSLVKYECDVKVIEKAGESFQDSEKDKYFDYTESRSIGEPDLLVDRILGYFSVRDREFDKFKKLENEIIHFKRIKFRDGDKFNAILDAIKKVKNYDQKGSKEKEIDAEFEKTKNKEKTFMIFHHNLLIMVQ